MRWCPRILFVISTLSLSWLGMMAVHELGHIAVALLTGGKVVRVVLHPAAISRTDVSPNPSPLLVAWGGPLVGCLIPVVLLMLLAIARKSVHAQSCNQAEQVYEQRLCSSIDADEGQSRATVSPENSMSVYETLMKPRNYSASHRRWSGRVTVFADLLQFFAGFCCIANGAYLGIGVFDRIGDAGEILKAGSPPSMLIAFGLIAFFAGLTIWHRLGSPLAILHNRTVYDSWLVNGLVATLILVIVVECLLSPT